MMTANGFDHWEVNQKEIELRLVLYLVVSDIIVPFPTIAQFVPAPLIAQFVPHPLTDWLIRAPLIAHFGRATLIAPFTPAPFIPSRVVTVSVASVIVLFRPVTTAAGGRRHCATDR